MTLHPPLRNATDLTDAERQRLVDRVQGLTQT
jgi:hypothetical protein